MIEPTTIRILIETKPTQEGRWIANATELGTERPPLKAYAAIEVWAIEKVQVQVLRALAERLFFGSCTAFATLKFLRPGQEEGANE